ncbi:MAG: cytochrome P460 family protein [Gammaproteobacteria bacterium]|nr:cytochrome P460 family protein [Gammaproteobacteria bacterium]
MKKLKTAIVAVLGIGIWLEAGGSSADEKQVVSFPDDHRGWQHVRSTVIHDQDNPLFGFLSVYADSKALKANKANKTYPSGSKIVGIFHDVVDKGGIMTQGKRLKYVVMVKDSQFKNTGGWGFEAFDASGKQTLTKDAKAECFVCHTSVADKDFVFSTFVE